MKIEPRGKHFVISKSGRYFAFFVDHDSHSWTKWKFGSERIYNSIEEAQMDLDEIKRRDKIKMQARKQRAKEAAEQSLVGRDK